MHFLLSHLDLFLDNCRGYSDEQGERAHQDMKGIEDRFKGAENYINAMGIYCWGLIRQTDPESHRRKSDSKTKYFYVKNF